jgi:hypothetical protein
LNTVLTVKNFLHFFSTLNSRNVCEEEINISLRSLIRGRPRLSQSNKSFSFSISLSQIWKFLFWPLISISSTHWLIPLGLLLRQTQRLCHLCHIYKKGDPCYLGTFFTSICLFTFSKMVHKDNFEKN